MQNQHDVIIVGAGPAGCAAATFAARCRWETLVIDKSIEDGFLGSLGNVSYFPGFPEAISGKDLLNRMKRQAELTGAHFIGDTATQVTTDVTPFRVKTQGDREFEARTIVIATGAASRTNYLHGEREYLGRGVSYDAMADGPAVAKRNAAVIGKSRHAIEEAIILARFAEKIHFIIPSNRLDADDALIRELQRHKSIELHFSTSLKKINGADHTNSITVFTSGQEKDMPVAGVFTYVHEYQATTGFLGKTVDMTANGAIKVDDNLSTSVKGVFACGDVLCGRPQLPAVATAQGLLAGLNADKYLSSGA